MMRATPENNRGHKALASAALVMLGLTAGMVAPKGLKGGSAVLMAMAGLTSLAAGVAIAHNEKLNPADYGDGFRYAVDQADQIIAPPVAAVTVRFLPEELIRDTGKATSWDTALDRLTKYSSGVTAPPDSGKSHTMHLMLQAIYKRQPQAHIRVFDRHAGKRGLDWFGLPKGRVVFTDIPDLMPLIDEFHAAIARKDISQEMHLFMPELASTLNRLGDLAETAIKKLEDIVEEGHGYNVFIHVDMQTTAVGRSQIPEGIKSSMWWIAVRPTTTDHLKEMRLGNGRELVAQCQMLAAANKRGGVVLTAYGVEVVEIPSAPLETLDIPTEDPMVTWLGSLDWDDLTRHPTSAKAWDAVITRDDLPDAFRKDKRRNGTRSNPWYVKFSAYFDQQTQPTEEDTLDEPV